MDEQLEEFKPEPQIKPEPDKPRKIKRIMYIVIILIFVFLIAWVSGIAARILN